MAKLFTQNHDWIEVHENTAKIGITEAMREEIGEIVFIQLPPQNASVKKEDVVAILESRKSAIDIYAPLTGTITEVNPALLESAAIINGTADTIGWLYKMSFSNHNELQGLLDEKAYQAFLTSNQEE